MKITVLLTLLMTVVPHALCCSCPTALWTRPRALALREAFCASRDVYLGTVLAVTCNCVPSPPQQGMYCKSYSIGQTANLVHEETLVLGAYTGDYGGCLHPYYHSTCSDVASRVTPVGYTVGNATSTATVRNVTDCSSFVCPFEPPMDRDWWYRSVNNLPCMYTIRIDATYKGNFQVGENITSTGPDVLTSCGWYGSTLLLGAQYLQGIGQVCSPIPEWGLPSSFKKKDRKYLRQLSRDSLSACDVNSVLTSTSEPIPSSVASVSLQPPVASVSLGPSVAITSLPPPPVMPSTHQPTPTTLTTASQETSPKALSPTVPPLVRGGASLLLPSSLLALPVILGLTNCY